VLTFMAPLSRTKVKISSMGERQRPDLIFDGEQRPDTFRLHIIHLATPRLKDPVVTPEL
jgi:hypothetical protein